MLDEIKSQLPDYNIIAITHQNFDRVFEVYNSNQDFYLLTQGKKATIDSSINDIIAIPPNCTIEQKIYLSIWKDDEIIGVLDVIAGYPEPTSFWIGLLLIHGRLHDKKIGSKVASAVLSAAKAAGYTTAQLGVIESNTRGIDFWRKHGFEVSRCSGDIVVMERRV